MSPPSDEYEAYVKKQEAGSQMAVEAPAPEPLVGDVAPAMTARDKMTATLISGEVGGSARHLRLAAIQALSCCAKLSRVIPRRRGEGGGFIGDAWELSWFPWRRQQGLGLGSEWSGRTDRGRPAGLRPALTLSRGWLATS